MNIKCKDTGEICNSYVEYINSKHWENFKREYSSKNKIDRCYLCSRKLKEYHFHHTNYENVGNEKANDVRVVCPSCHRIYHDNNKRKLIELVEKERYRPYSDTQKAPYIVKWEKFVGINKQITKILSYCQRHGKDFKKEHVIAMIQKAMKMYNAKDAVDRKWYKENCTQKIATINSSLERYGLAFCLD